MVPIDSLAKGVGLLASVIHIQSGLLRSFDRNWELSQAGSLAIYVLTRQLGYTVKDVANHFGRAPETISSFMTRFTVHNLQILPWIKKSNASPTTSIEWSVPVGRRIVKIARPDNHLEGFSRLGATWLR